jgi:hypothetical protein
MQTSGSRLRLFTLIVSFGGALVGCEGGAYYDADTGRIVNGSAPMRASAAPPSKDGAQPAADAPSAYGVGQGPSAHAAPSYDRGPATSASAGSWTTSSGSPSSFDPASRTPPAPQLQSDGTPLKPQLAQVSPPSGPAAGGNEVLITGSGFANAQVMFGHEPAQVTSQSSNAITVIAPEGAAGAPGTIVVTNRDGSYAVAGAAYAYR